MNCSEKDTLIHNGHIDNIYGHGDSLLYNLRLLTGTDPKYKKIYSLKFTSSMRGMSNIRSQTFEKLSEPPQKKTNNNFSFIVNLKNDQIEGSFSKPKALDNTASLRRNSHCILEGLKIKQIDKLQSPIKYAEGISSMRLFNGRISAALVNNESEDGDDLNFGLGPKNALKRRLKNSALIKKESIFKIDLEDENTHMKSIQRDSVDEFTEIHNHERLVKSIATMKKSNTSNGLIVIGLISFALYSILYVVQNRTMMELKDQLILYTKVNRGYSGLFSLLCKAHSPLIDMLLYNQGAFVNDLDKSEFEEIMKARLQFASKLLTQSKAEFYNSLKGLSNDVLYKSVASDLSVDCYLNPTTKIRSTLLDCLQRIQSSILNIDFLPMEEITMKNPDVYMVMMNTVNDIQLFLKAGYERWPEEINDIAINNSSLLVLRKVEIPLFIYTALFAVGVYKMVAAIVRKHEEILEMYYSFKKSDLKQLEYRCEYFLDNLINRDNTLDELDEEDIYYRMFQRNDSGGGDEITLPSAGNRKGQLKKYFWLRILIIVIVSTMHQIYVYSSNELLYKMISSRESVIKLSSELNVADMIFLSPQNKLKGTIYNQTKLYWNIESSKAWSDYRINEQQKAIKLFRIIYVDNDMHTWFREMYAEIFQGDLCDFSVAEFEEAEEDEDYGVLVTYEGVCENLFNSTLRHV